MEAHDETRKRLKIVERNYRSAVAKAEKERHRRNTLVCQARRSGMTFGEIAAGTGLTRGRIAQIVDEGGKR